MTDKPRLFYVECAQPRRMAAALIETEGVVGVHLDGDRIRIESSDAGNLAHTLPRIAVEENLVVNRVEPVDESLESVFRYLVKGG